MFRHLIGAALLLLLAAAPDRAAAQYWATKEVCAVGEPAIDPAAITPELLAEFQSEALAIPNPTGRLWRITSPSGAVSHLWGTFHSNDPLILDLPPELLEVLRTAKVVAPEFDAIAKSRRALERQALGEDLYRVTGDHQDYAEMDARVLAWIGSRLISNGWGEDALAWLRIEALAEQVLADPCGDFAWGILPIQDDRVTMLALIEGARLVGLEGPDDFTNTLARRDRRETALAIIEAYGAYLNPEDYQAARRSNFALYLEGRIGEMMAWDRHYMAQIFGPEKGARLLDLTDDYLLRERNEGFVETALPLLDAGDAVLAVGAFHLPGETGLIELFRQAGYRVDRVVTEGEADG